MIQYAELVLPHVDEPLSSQIKDIIHAIEEPYRIHTSLSMLCTYGIIKLFIHFLPNLVGPRKELVYQHASMYQHFNDTFVISNDSSKEKLLAEIDAPDQVLFQKAFAKHCASLHFNNGDSGLTPYKILALNVYIQRLSPTFYDLSSDSDS